MIELKELRKEDIADRAYALYAQRGSEPGRDVEDWLRAEKELSSAGVIGTEKAKAAEAGRNWPNRHALCVSTTNGRRLVGRPIPPPSISSQVRQVLISRITGHLPYQCSTIRFGRYPGTGMCSRAN